MMSRAAAMLLLSVAFSPGCSSRDEKTDLSGAEPLRTSLPLDLSVGDLTDEQVDALCSEAGAWARRETQRQGVDAIRRGMCVSYSEFVGRAYPETYLATCNNEYPLCLKETVDPDADTAIGRCALRSERSKCKALPTVGELVACYEVQKATTSAWFLSIADKSCADYVTTPLVTPAGSPACALVYQRCGNESLF